MTFKIHAVMQHANDQDLIRSGQVENNMGLLSDAAKLRGDILCASPKMRVVEQRIETGLQLIAIFARSLDTELGNRVIRYITQVIPGSSADT